MAVLDAYTLLSGSISAANVLTGQTVTGTDTSVVSTNSYDTRGGLSQSVDLGLGTDLDILIRILTAWSGGTSVECQYISADDDALTTNVTVLASSGARPVAELTAGQLITLPMPPKGNRTLRRYVGVRYVTVGAVAAGAVAAFIGLDADTVPGVYPTSGFTIA